MFGPKTYLKAILKQAEFKEAQGDRFEGTANMVSITNRQYQTISANVNGINTMHICLLSVCSTSMFLCWENWFLDSVSCSRVE